MSESIRTPITVNALVADLGYLLAGPDDREGAAEPAGSRDAGTLR